MSFEAEIERIEGFGYLLRLEDTKKQTRVALCIEKPSHLRQLFKIIRRQLEDDGVKL